MPYGRSYRKKAKKAVKKYANKRVAKKVAYKIGSKFVPGLNVVSTADDIIWVGNRAYRYLKNRQLKNTDKTVEAAMQRGQNSKSPQGRGRRKRYGIDDWY